LTGAFPDVAVTVDEVVSDGRNAVVRWRLRMTHTGDHLGVPPTGERIETHGMTWMVVEGGRIVEGWDGWDATAVLSAVGAAPPSRARPTPPAGTASA
jgi:predicted ester cyclase